MTLATGPMRFDDLERAVDALLARIDDRPVEERILPARLIPRQSTAV